MPLQHPWLQALRHGSIVTASGTSIDGARLKSIRSFRPLQTESENDPKDPFLSMRTSNEQNATQIGRFTFVHALSAPAMSYTRIPRPTVLKQVHFSMCCTCPETDRRKGCCAAFLLDFSESASKPPHDTSVRSDDRNDLTSGDDESDPRSPRAILRLHRSPVCSERAIAPHHLSIHISPRISVLPLVELLA